jgi:hypothetical protein
MLDKLTKKKINRIVFTATSKKEITVNLAPPDQEVVMSLANCLVNEAKTLIKQ